LRAALIAALEKALNGKLDPAMARRLINAAKMFNAEQDKRSASLRKALYGKENRR